MSTKIQIVAQFNSVIDLLICELENYCLLGFGDWDREKMAEVPQWSHVRFLSDYSVSYSIIFIAVSTERVGNKDPVS